jgi:hypothetical protein
LWEPHLHIVDHGGNGMTPCMADAAGLPPVDIPEYVSRCRRAGARTVPGLRR